MTVELLSDLRAPPVVGRFYMVPVIEDFPWYGRVRDWPVLGPQHADVEFFNFRYLHYHIDIRFVVERDFRYMAAHSAPRCHGKSDTYAAALSASAAPLHNMRRPLPKGRPRLMPRQCRREGMGAPIVDYVPLIIGEMEARYGSPAEPIRRRDGRLLCPHRKVDLASFPPDAEGIVVCPLHGLRVRCGVPQ